MKKTFCFTLMIVFIIAFYSCSKPKGDWPDNIGLSTKVVEFNAQSDSVTITTFGSSWWIGDVSVNSDWYYNFNLEVNLETDSYIIKHDCFTVERRDKHKLLIKVDENPLNIQRIITVGLQAGDYFDRVTITQKPKL